MGGLISYMGSDQARSAASKDPTEGKATTEQEQQDKETPDPKVAVFQPKFVAPPDTQNPFDTAQQQAARYSQTPQAF